MNPLDEQVEAVIAILRSQGGVVGIDPHSPDYVKRAFLDTILSCPDCRQAVLGKHDGRGN